MFGSGIADPRFISPVVEVFFKALLLAEKESAPEIGVSHLLAALDNPTPESKPAEQSAGPLAPVPHLDKPLASEVMAAIEAAVGSAPVDFEQLTLDSLRNALLRPRTIAQSE